MRSTLLVFSLFLAFQSGLRGQDHPPNADKAVVWPLMQAFPSVSWTSFPAATHFAFEWEATPLLYSFGINRLVSPVKSIVVTPTARYSGSVELVVSGLVYTSDPGGGHLGYSAQLLGHLPLVEKGEYLSLTVGAGRYVLAGRPHNMLIAGGSTFFGILQATVKVSPDSDLWMTSIEFRLF